MCVHDNWSSKIMNYSKSFSIWHLLWLHPLRNDCEHFSLNPRHHTTLCFCFGPGMLWKLRSILEYLELKWHCRQPIVYRHFRWLLYDGTSTSDVKRWHLRLPNQCLDAWMTFVLFSCCSVRIAGLRLESHGNRTNILKCHSLKHWQADPSAV